MANYPELNRNEAKVNTLLGESVGTSDPKHVQLDHAISSLDNVISHAVSLLHRITGEDGQGTESSSTPKSPSLEEVLDTGPQRIRGSAENIHALLDQISDRLF
jgi:hypothetical protein